ncbi:hypothetical protein [Sphingomonas psychrotolerans]|uniref:Uncharacterized protein n=1 Tax=Sphingomonas psychrotolerans TaxID=1327635 RepID=A0A2K8MJ14_9SPHN|nr:hypothetical protein [Sphingomonas psychrotolerans]ATY31181.1 hypothetical protein CVN68_03615 [Sphingomonas psychrotolerans]
MAGLAVAAWGGKPDETQVVRPDWRGASIEGIAPLMSPSDVEAALKQRGYRQVRCLSDGQLLADPLNQEDASPCYAAPGRPMRIILYFLGLREGRRLAVVNFKDSSVAQSSREESLAASQAYAEELQSRFGLPMRTVEHSSFRTLYWRRPGGNPSLPDMISTSVGDAFGANVTMTSMWAYGQARQLASSPASKGN